MKNCELSLNLEQTNLILRSLHRELHVMSLNDPGYKVVLNLIGEFDKEAKRMRQEKLWEGVPKKTAGGHDPWPGY